MLRDLSGQLSSLTGPRQTTDIDQTIVEMTAELEATVERCRARLEFVTNAMQQATTFYEQLSVCSAPQCQMENISVFVIFPFITDWV